MSESRTSGGWSRGAAFTVAAIGCFGLMCFFAGYRVGGLAPRQEATQLSGRTLPAGMAKNGASGLEMLAKPMARTGSMDPDPLESFMEVFEQLRAKYYKPIPDTDRQKLFYGAVRGMLRELGDPYTRFMEPKDYTDFQQDNEGRFKGIGAMVGIDRSTNRIQIVRVFENNPAAKAGLKAGDYVIKINDEPTDDMSVDVAVSKMKGEANTKVKLTVMRAKKAAPIAPELLKRYGVTEDELENAKDPAPVDPTKLIDIVVTRGDVHVPIVETEMLPGNIGYLHLVQFNDESYEQTVKGCEELKAKGAKGLVFDLRDNPGGNLDQVVRIVSYFKSEGPVVWVQERDKSAEPINVEQAAYGKWKVPMAVLVNGFSASASEIFTGAMQDAKLGTIVGEKTYGKGLVQTVLPLHDQSALVVTTAVYLTPAKRDINKKGIDPDVKVPWDRTDMEKAFTAATAKNLKRIDWDIQLQKAVSVVKSGMSGAAAPQKRAALSLPGWVR